MILSGTCTCVQITPGKKLLQSHERWEILEKSTREQHSDCSGILDGLCVNIVIPNKLRVMDRNVPGLKQEGSESAL